METFETAKENEEEQGKVYTDDIPMRNREGERD